MQDFPFTIMDTGITLSIRVVVENDGTEEIAFDKVAEAMGCHGERVADPAELDGALQRCIDSGKPSVVHVDVDPNMHLFAPGLQEFKAMHQEPGA